MSSRLPAMVLNHIRSRLADYEPLRVEGSLISRAAVAMILRDRGDDTEVLLIQRAEREGDPWSGHMALPGGRQARADRDVIHTAARETREEVGIDIQTHGQVLGVLDELRAIAGHGPIDLVISPIVWDLRAPVEPSPCCAEVEDTVWVPLSFLQRPTARGIYRCALDGIEQEYPAYCYRGYTVWGLTHRILSRFLELVR
ncbi:MAG: hypothetical protein A3J75_08985 [Acidobacteria bacterium RBG_16_68_9]|nr:MAG: hypothetical protein A3J75_08985 [Acidobacteria bacterium RBG_16_68_9]